MRVVDTEVLPLLPLPDGVVGPGMVVTIALDTDEARIAAEAAMEDTGRLLLVPQVDGRYARVGTVAKVEDMGELPGGRRALVVRGIERARVGTGVAGPGPGLWVSTDPVASPPPSEEAVALARQYRAVVESILERRGAGRLAQGLRSVTEPGALADTALYSPDLSAEQKVEILETLDVTERLTKVLGWTRETLADLAVKDEIDHEVTEGLGKAQREAVLRRQMEAIRKELGEGDDDIVAQYRRRLSENAVPEAVATAVTREIDKLERMGAQSPEHGWILAWLDTDFDLPWGDGKVSEPGDDQLSLEGARAVLDADHSGLTEVKDRIIELLAVRKLLAERGEPTTDQSRITGRRGGGAILALVGPPGVGKTSLGESVARTMGRPFARVALGGVRDEAEVRGHRRTYVGARPGRLVRALTEAGAMNPVLLLDEIDKLGADWRGDPSSALLEVLDPAQNHTFRAAHRHHACDLDFYPSAVAAGHTKGTRDSSTWPVRP